MLLPILTVLATRQPADFKKQAGLLESRYQELNRCIKHLDFGSLKIWMAANASSDFFDHPSGYPVLNTTETVDMLKTQFLILKSVQDSSFKLGNISIHPERMSCSVKTHLDAMTKDKRHLVSDALAVDSWKLIKGNWKIVSMVTTKQHSTLNGKTIGAK